MASSRPTVASPVVGVPVASVGAGLGLSHWPLLQMLTVSPPTRRRACGDSPQQSRQGCCGALGCATFSWAGLCFCDSCGHPRRWLPCRARRGPAAVPSRGAVHGHLGAWSCPCVSLSPGGHAAPTISACAVLSVGAPLTLPCRPAGPGCGLAGLGSLRPADGNLVAVSGVLLHCCELAVGPEAPPHPRATSHPSWGEGRGWVGFRDAGLLQRASEQVEAPRRAAGGRHSGSSPGPSFPGHRPAPPVLRGCRIPGARGPDLQGGEGPGG